MLYKYFTFVLDWCTLQAAEASCLSCIDSIRQIRQIRKVFHSEIIVYICMRFIQYVFLEPSLDVD
jgi:hypothetical protein